MANWTSDIVKALNNLGGKAKYEDIYAEIKNIRSQPLPQSWKQTIQNTIQGKSSESNGYNGVEDLFYPVNGLGSGVWGLRDEQYTEEIKKISKELFGSEKKETTTFEEIQRKFENEVKVSINDSKEKRENRLNRANLTPKKIETTITIYSRNPDVVAEVLLRANGICEKCNNPAPFIRAKDNTPFLEVHHVKQLSNAGEDSVNNALALCPNCHRELHYGIKKS